MTLTSIISAIGNNSTIYPLLVRDCCIEVPSKIYIARKENLKESEEVANDATRENLLMNMQHLQFGLEEFLQQNTLWINISEEKGIILTLI